MKVGAGSASVRNNPCAFVYRSTRSISSPSTRESKVLERSLVDGEERRRGSVFGAHVRQGRPVRDRERGKARSVELDEPSDDPVGAEHLRQREDEIGRGRARRQSARHLHADDVRLGKERRLSQHGRFGLDPADAPAEHAEAVDHRGVGVGPHQRVGECHPVAHAHDLPEMLQVHLVADPGARRNDAEPVERLLSPSEERVPLTVAPVLPFDVGLVRVRRPEEVDLDRVIDDQVHGHERVDRGRIPAGSGDGAPHRREVDDRRHTGEVLHQDATRHERHVRRRLGPSCERAHVVVRDVPGSRRAGGGSRAGS